MAPTSRALPLLGLALVLPAAGCCSMAALFCGPDRSRWVPVSYRTHREALETFLEAVGRDHVRVIWEALSPGFRERRRIPGSFEAAVAWERIKQETPGAHLLRRAEVGDAVVYAPDRVGYVLDVLGRRIRVDLVRLPYLAVRYALDGDAERAEDYVTSLVPFVELRPQPDYDTELVLRITDLELPEGISPDDVVEVTANHEWKIDGLEQVR